MTTARLPRPELSVVVIAYDMARELPRTIRSLSPLMQRGIAEERYEIIVVDNGSRRPFDRDLCASFGGCVRFLDVPEPTPSPVAAANLGLAAATGDVVGVMIDGARLASPGLLAGALRSHGLGERTVIAALSFHLGPGQQYETVTAGYDASVEDALLASVEWQSDGYRLFDIAVFADSAALGWFATPAESNALFMSARLWDELGGYDERFRSPGGGFANLDVFRRACSLPGAELIVLLGEGTFHQIHGGTTTNRTAGSLVPGFEAEYVRIRGEPLRPADLKPEYVGHVEDLVLPSIAASARGWPRWRTPTRRILEGMADQPSSKADAARPAAPAAPPTMRGYVDPLRRVEVVDDLQLPPTKTCIVTASGQRYRRLVSDLLSSIRANLSDPDARLVVLNLDGSTAVDDVARRWGAVPIRCRPLAPCSSWSKAVFYGISSIVPAERYVCLDGDTLVLTDLGPLLELVEANPGGLLLAREANDRRYADLWQAFTDAYGGVGELSFFRRDTPESRYPFVVNDGVMAGDAAAFGELASTLATMGPAVEWLDSDPDLHWRNQFVLNIALARHSKVVELDPSWNVQLHAQEIAVEHGHDAVRAIWRGAPVGILHISGGDKRRPALRALRSQFERTCSSSHR